MALLLGSTIGFTLLFKTEDYKNDVFRVLFGAGLVIDMMNWLNVDVFLFFLCIVVRLSWFDNLQEGWLSAGFLFFRCEED